LQESAPIFTLKIEAAGSSETLVTIYHTTRSHNIEYSIFITGEGIAGFVKVNGH
jgi:hypothetical protein